MYKVLKHIVLMLLTMSLLCVSVYAQTYDESPTGIVMDADGMLWYMPEQIPLTFLSEDDRSMLIDGEMYSDTSLRLVDGRSNAQIIWDYWYYKTGNAKGVAGLMGNIRIESGFYANQLHNGYARYHGITDEEYTQAVDNGTYTNFVHDGAGYGLVQWTYWSLKERLLNYALSTERSIGDIYMQLDFLYKEFEERYIYCMNAIKDTSTIRYSSDCILLNFERPTDQSEEMQRFRARLGEDIYNKCIGRCETLDRIKCDIEQRLCSIRDRRVMLRMNYTVNDMWTSFLGNFYQETVHPICGHKFWIVTADDC